MKDSPQVIRLVDIPTCFLPTIGRGITLRTVEGTSLCHTCGVWHIKELRRDPNGDHFATFGLPIGTHCRWKHNVPLPSNYYVTVHGTPEES